MGIERRQDAILLSMLIAGDLAALVVSHWATGQLRLSFNDIFARPFTTWEITHLFPPVMFVAPLWVLTFALVGSYRILGKRRKRTVAVESAKDVSVAVALQVVVLFFLTRTAYARSMVVIFLACSLLLVIGARLLVLYLARVLKSRGVAGEAVAVVGTGVMARLVRNKLDSPAEARFRFVGFLADGLTTADERAQFGDDIVGEVGEAEQVFNRCMVRRVIVAAPEMNREVLVPLALACARLGVSLERVPDLLGLLAARPEITDLDGLPLLALEAPRFTRSAEVLKRVTDLVLGSIISLLSAPLGLAAALAVRLDSPGPVLYSQRRVGKGGKHFNFFKFRSMYVDADSRREELDARNEAGGYIFKMKGDPRVTRIGRILRRLSLDELPQLINVLKGDMSLVGPRPLPIGDVPVELNAAPYSLWLERRRRVAPGITGLWQVSGRSDLPFQEMVRLDLFYVERWSIAWDLLILLRTIPVILRGSGAY